jgi:hypothetical protein
MLLLLLLRLLLGRLLGCWRLPLLLLALLLLWLLLALLLLWLLVALLLLLSREGHLKL